VVAVVMIPPVGGAGDRYTKWPPSSRRVGLRVEPAVSWRQSRLAATAEFELDAAEDGSSSAADRLGVRLIGGNAIKQPGADGDPMINAESSWS